MPNQNEISCVGNGLAESHGALAAGASSVNGYMVSPHGDLKVLVIFAGYLEEAEPTCSTFGTSEWPNTIVNGVVNKTTLPANLNTYFYQNTNQFAPTATDQTISNYFYQMSRTSANPFRPTFGWLPNRINVSYAAFPNIFNATHEAIQQAVDQNPTFDWASYDRRTNWPNFNSDNSNSAPDGKLDYVVVVWRTYRSCTVMIGGDSGAAGNSLAYPSTVTIPPNGSRTQTYSIPDGQLQTGFSPNLLVHEFAHNLYNPPHMLAADGCVGNRLFTTDGWGMMADIPTMFSANAWERWHLGWLELQASNGQSYVIKNDDGTQTVNAVRVNSDVQDAASLTATNGYYTLRDFVSTGDVVRIKLPNATNQYLWLENRAKSGPFDRRNDLTWQGFLSPSKGLLAMVESLGDRTPIGFIVNNDITRINQLRTVSAEGNFDYVASGAPSTYNGHLYGNLLYNFTTTPNASGGANQMTLIRLDKNGDNVLRYDPTSGNQYGHSSENEWTWQMVQNGQINDGTFGPNIGSRTVGFRYGLESNPLLMPNQTIVTSGSGTGTSITITGLTEIPLNGLSVEITAYDANTGDLTVKVRYDNITIGKDTRWTGQLRTYPIANTLQPGYAILLNAGRRLTLDRSKTPQRNILSPQNDFVNDTKLRVASGAKLFVSTCANLDLKGAGTQLFVEDGAGVYLNGCGQITAYAGTDISVNNQSDIGGGGTGTVVLKVGSTMHIRSTGQVIQGTM